MRDEDIGFVRERLDRYARKGEGPDDCWMWTGPFRLTQNKSGPRGFIQLSPIQGKRRRVIAHRAAYVVWVGPIPEGKEVCHSCDVSLCVNPGHLFPGTHEDNMRDCSQKGRIRTTARTGTCFKLTALQVAEIRTRRAAGESGVKLGLEFDVCHSHIYRIANKLRRVRR